MSGIGLTDTKLVSVEDFVAIIALSLLIYGLTDITDGFLGVRSWIDKTARKVRTGPAARRIGITKVVFGLLTISIAVIGIGSRAWVS